MQFSWTEMLTNDRVDKTYWTDAEIPERALRNMKKLQSALNELGRQYTKPALVNSVFRNGQVAGGAKYSPHMIGSAIDIQDTNAELATFCMTNTKLLQELGLYLENPFFTHTCKPNTRPSSGWVHLDVGGYSADFLPQSRKTVVFNPF